MKAGIWISYDLGVRGDYEGMYTFLDSFEAKECGDSTAYLLFEYDINLEEELKKIIREHVTLAKRSRVYVLRPVEGGKYKGRFIFGRRKRAAWAGYSGEESDEEDDIE